MFLQENKELHEIIMNLRDEKNMKSNEVKELKTALSAVHEGNIELMKGQVLRLTALVTKLERNLNAKQVFCETVVTENDSLKNELQSLRDDRVTRVRDLKRGLGQLSTQPDVRRILNQVYDTPDGDPEVNNQTQVVFKKMMVLSSFLCFVLLSNFLCVCLKMKIDYFLIDLLVTNTYFFRSSRLFFLNKDAFKWDNEQENTLVKTKMLGTGGHGFCNLLLRDSYEFRI